MRHEEFAEILEQQLARVSAVLGVKTKEYATEDQLHNIRMSATLQGESMAEAVAGMMVKHTISIFTMVKDGKPHPEAKWDEKITDHIVWLVLLKAALIEDAKISSEINVSDILRKRADSINANTFLIIDGLEVNASLVLQYAATMLERIKPNPDQEHLPC